LDTGVVCQRTLVVRCDGFSKGIFTVASHYTVYAHDLKRQAKNTSQVPGTALQNYNQQIIPAKTFNKRIKHQAGP